MTLTTLFVTLLAIGTMLIASGEAVVVDVTVNMSAAGVAVSPDLFGIFFEEINHAGVGGLYQQQIDNSNFETNAKTVDPWTVSFAGQLSLDSSMPLNAKQPTAMRVDIAAATAGVILTNPGFWGIRAENGGVYNVSMFIRSSTPNTVISVNVGIASADGSESYASATITDRVTEEWQKVTTLLTSSHTDYGAVFTMNIVTSGVASLFLDVITVMPVTSYKGLTFIRPDLAEMLDNLHPSFVRFPGGNYIEGSLIQNRFNWKNCIGPIENRTGHYNDHWNYYTEDGLALYEFLLWIETLTDPADQPTRVIWVVFNGVSMAESVPPSQLGPYIQDALDSVDFAIGDSSVPSSWASLRAEMGHPTPFRIDWIAIGNEGCGKPYYTDNYILFYLELKKKFPQIKLIANCLFDELKNKTKNNIPIDYWDYHIYSSPDELLTVEVQERFDIMNRSTSYYIFNSEYASHGKTAGNGNMIGAVAEAVWMSGLQRNSDLVKMASYAPLLENINSPAPWKPNMIRFVQGNGGHSVYGTPSYWNQWMFARSHIGIDPLTHVTLSYELSTNTTVAVAPSRGLSKVSGDEILVLKLINYGNETVNLHLSLVGVDSTVTWRGQMWTMSSSNRSAENSLENPTAISPTQSDVNIMTKMTIVMAVNSITIIQATRTSQSTMSNRQFHTQ